MNAAPKTLRRLSELSEAGLAGAAKRAALERVAAQYAVAITPAMAVLIDRTRSARSDRAAVRPRSGRARCPARRERRSDRRRRAQPGRRHRPPLSRPRAAQAHGRLRGLLPLLLPARDDRARRQAADGAPARRRARLHRGAPEIWEVILTGGDPLVLSARRLEDSGRQACRHRARQGRSASTPAFRSPIRRGSRASSCAR